VVGPKVERAFDTMENLVGTVTEESKKKKKVKKAKENESSSTKRVLSAVEEIGVDDMFDGTEHDPYLGRLFIFNILCAFDFGCWLPSLNPLSKLGASENQILSFLGTYVGAALLSSFIIGARLEKRPIGNMFIVCAVFSLIGSGLYVAAQNADTLYFVYPARAVSGFGAGLGLAGYGHLIRSSMILQRSQRIAAYCGLDLVARTSSIALGAAFARAPFFPVWYFASQNSFCLLSGGLFFLFVIFLFVFRSFGKQTFTLLDLFTRVPASEINDSPMRDDDMSRGGTGTTFIFTFVQLLVTSAYWAYLVSFLGSLEDPTSQWARGEHYDLFLYMACVSVLVLVIVLRVHLAFDSPQPLMAAIIGLVAALLLASETDATSRDHAPELGVALLVTAGLLSCGFTLAVAIMTLITLIIRLTSLIHSNTLDNPDNLNKVAILPATMSMWSSTKKARKDSAHLSLAAAGLVAGPVFGYMAFQWAGRIVVMNLCAIALMSALLPCFLGLLQSQFLTVRLANEGKKTSGTSSPMSAFSEPLLDRDF
jgi:hypothetical protein